MCHEMPFFPPHPFKNTKTVLACGLYENHWWTDCCSRRDQPSRFGLELSPPFFPTPMNSEGSVPAIANENVEAWGTKQSGKYWSPVLPAFLFKAICVVGALQGRWPFARG